MFCGAIVLIVAIFLWISLHLNKLNPAVVMQPRYALGAIPHH